MLINSMVYIPNLGFFPYIPSPSTMLDYTLLFRLPIGTLRNWDGSVDENVAVSAIKDREDSNHMETEGSPKLGNISPE